MPSLWEIATLALMAAIESIFWPIPPDLLLVGLVLVERDAWLILALITTAGSVGGAIAGYAIGRTASGWVHRRVGRHLTRIDQLYQAWGGWAVLIAAFTPIPYKVFTLTSGLFRLPILPFILASVVGRGARFLIVAYAAQRYGEDAIALVNRLGWWSIPILLAVAAIAGAIWHRHRRANAHRARAADTTPTARDEP